MESHDCIQLIEHASLQTYIWHCSAVTRCFLGCTLLLRYAPEDAVATISQWILSTVAAHTNQSFCWSVDYNL